MLANNLALPFIPLYVQRDLGVSNPRDAAIWAGLATASTGLAMAMMAPIWGLLADRHGRKAMLVRAQFALALSNTASGLVLAPWQLVTVRAAQGGFSGVVGAARALVAGTVPRDRVPFAMGLIQSAIFLGQTLGPALGGLLGSALGFRAAFFGTASINLVSGVLAMLYVRDAPPAEGPRAAGGRAGLGKVLRSRPLATVVSTLFLATAATTCIRPVLPLLLGQIDPGGDVAATSGVAFGVLGMAGAVASLASGRAGARVGLHRLLVLAALGGGGANLLVGTAGTSLMVVAVLSVVGLCQGMLNSCATALVSLHAPASRQGTAFGLLTSGQGLAFALGPLAGGLVGSAVGLDGAFVLAAALLLVAALLGATAGAPPRMTVRAR